MEDEGCGGGEREGGSEVVDGTGVSPANKRLSFVCQWLSDKRRRAHRKTDNCLGKGDSVLEHQAPMSKIVPSDPSVQGRPIKSVAGRVGGTRHVIAGKQRREEREEKGKQHTRWVGIVVCRLIKIVADHVEGEDDASSPFPCNGGRGRKTRNKTYLVIRNYGRPIGVGQLRSWWAGAA